MIHNVCIAKLRLTSLLVVRQQNVQNVVHSCSLFFVLLTALIHLAQHFFFDHLDAVLHTLLRLNVESIPRQDVEVGHLSQSSVKGSN